MPSDLSTWLVSVPQNGDSEGLLQELKGKLANSKILPASNLAELLIPSLKVSIYAYASIYRQSLYSELNFILLSS
jgi:hypothetical protein